MTPPKTVVLDNEAVQGLRDVQHRKHRRVMATIEAVTERNVRQAGAVDLVVPTTVRVEAGWDRGAPASAVLNRLRVRDSPLDPAAANHAARTRDSVRVSVADSHIAALIACTPGPTAVLTSDVDDLQALGHHLGVDIRVVRV